MTTQTGPQHVSFILLAEFDINQGSILPHQYPFPTGTDDQLLAELMIPDGAHSFAQDWTIFFLNQTPGNTIAPVFSDAHSDKETINGTTTKGDPELIYVLNLVRTKMDPTVPRGGTVKAMAICTRHPFIQIFQPVLLVALDEYFANPSVDVLARLFDAVNAMDLSAMPTLTMSEKLILRNSERKDTFIEKFAIARKNSAPQDILPQERGFYGSSSEDVQQLDENAKRRQSRSDSAALRHSRSPSIRSTTSSNGSLRDQVPPWDGDESTEETQVPTSLNGQDREPSPVDTDEDLVVVRPQSTAGKGEVHKIPADRLSLSSKATSSSRPERADSWVGINAHSSESESDHRQTPSNFDTHFYSANIILNNYNLPIKVPTSTFPGEVGDYSLIQLIQVFSSPIATVTGPLHPHLHTNGILTHPVIVLFNALVTQKRIIFLGYGKPAGHVANFVLAACALGSGCGCVLRGFTQRAFPYTNLTNNHVLVSVPGFIAGVTNPIYETMPVWDVLCNIETGKITIHKDIQPPLASAAMFPIPPSVIPRSGVLSAVNLDEDPSKLGVNGVSVRGDFVARSDNADNVFMEDILTSIAYHYGEGLVRARFADYVHRFVRLASRYEEDTLGKTNIGLPSSPFGDGQLGSGIVLDDATGARELSANVGRIEGWRRSDSYEYYKADFRAFLKSQAIRGFDVPHQISRLRNAKTLSDMEVDLIIKSFALGARTYEQIIELLAWLPAHAGGLLPISFGLFHQQESIRDSTVDFLTGLRAHNIGVQFLQSLNQFHRMAYVRLAQARETSSSNSAFSSSSASLSQPTQLGAPMNVIRTASNLSSNSSGGG